MSAGLSQENWLSLLFEKAQQGAYPHRKELEENPALASLFEQGLIRKEQERYILNWSGLLACQKKEAKKEQDAVKAALFLLKELYRRKRTKRFTLAEISRQLDQKELPLARSLTTLSSLPIWIFQRFDQKTGFLEEFSLSDTVLFAKLEPVLLSAKNSFDENTPLRLIALELEGFGPLAKIRLELGNCNVYCGPSASGKSSLVEFFRFLCFASKQELPETILPERKEKTLFSAGLPEAIRFSATFLQKKTPPFRYEAEINGEGPPKIFRERFFALVAEQEDPFIFLGLTMGRGFAYDQKSQRLQAPKFKTQPNRLSISLSENPTLKQAVSFLSSIRVYSPLMFCTPSSNQTAKNGEQNDYLKRDAGNLYERLFALKNSYPASFEVLEKELKLAIPDFRALQVEKNEFLKIRWAEHQIRDFLSLQDISSGFFHFLCMATICCSPNLPSLLCLDEPDIGLSPELLPALAALLRKTAKRTQVLLTTSSIAFTKYFSHDECIFLQKEKGWTRTLLPYDGLVQQKKPEI